MIRTVKKWWHRWRSSKTGQFLTKEQAAKLDPDTTEDEKVRRKRGPSQSDYHSGSA